MVLHRRAIRRFKESDLILNFDKIRADVTDFIRGNPITASAVGVGAPLAFVGIATVGRRIAKRRKLRVTKKRKKKVGKRKRTTGRRIRRRKVGKRRKFGLRQPVSSKKIRFTKKGQPYIILRNGRARFIRKSSARSAKARKGGFS